jgi:hypothetical protein
MDSTRCTIRFQGKDCFSIDTQRGARLPRTLGFRLSERVTIAVFRVHNLHGIAAPEPRFVLFVAFPDSPFGCPALAISTRRATYRKAVTN